MVTCSVCQKVSNDDEHYQYKLKCGTTRPINKCKECYNKGKYVKRGTGFAILSKDVQDEIIRMLQDKSKYAAIQRETGVEANRIRRWVKNGSIPLP